MDNAYFISRYATYNGTVYSTKYTTHYNGNHVTYNAHFANYFLTENNTLHASYQSTFNNTLYASDKNHYATYYRAHYSNCGAYKAADYTHNISQREGNYTTHKGSYYITDKSN